VTAEAQLFDALVDAVGPEAAVDAVEQTLNYARSHTACSLPGGAQIIDDVDGLRIQFRHDPNCPTLTEGERP
jgi:hypothetical protein